MLFLGKKMVCRDNSYNSSIKKSRALLAEMIQCTIHTNKWAWLFLNRHNKRCSEGIMRRSNKRTLELNQLGHLACVEIDQGSKFICTNLIGYCLVLPAQLTIYHYFEQSSKTKIKCDTDLKFLLFMMQSFPTFVVCFGIRTYTAFHCQAVSADSSGITMGHTWGMPALINAGLMSSVVHSRIVDPNTGLKIWTIMSAAVHNGSHLKGVRLWILLIIQLSLEGYLNSIDITVHFVQYDSFFLSIRLQWYQLSLHKMRTSEIVSYRKYWKRIKFSPATWNSGDSRTAKSFGRRIVLMYWRLRFAIIGDVLFCRVWGALSEEKILHGRISVSFDTG